MKLFIFTFIIFSLGWWSSYVHNYLYEKYKENKRDNAIRKEIEHLDYLNIEDGSDGYDKYVDQYDVLQIIDKYKGVKE